MKQKEKSNFSIFLLCFAYFNYINSIETYASFKESCHQNGVDTRINNFDPGPYTNINIYEYGIHREMEKYK